MSGDPSTRSAAVAKFVEGSVESTLASAAAVSLSKAPGVVTVTLADGLEVLPARSYAATE